MGIAPTRLIRRGQYFGGRAAVALAALALAVQASLPLLLAVELRIDAADEALEVENQAGAAPAATPLNPEHHCNCPTCQILAAGQSYPLASHPVIAVSQPAPSETVTLAVALPPPASFPSAYQARAPPIVG